MYGTAHIPPDTPKSNFPFIFPNHFLQQHTTSSPTPPNHQILSQQFSTTFSNFSDLIFAFSTSQPLAPKRPNLQRPIFQPAHQQPSPSKLVPFSPQKLNRFCHLLHQPFKNCTPEALFHDIFHQNQPTLIHSLISPRMSHIFGRCASSCSKERFAAMWSMS